MPVFRERCCRTSIFNNGVYQPQLSLNGTVAGDLAIGPDFPEHSAWAANAAAILERSTSQFASPDFRQPYTQQADIAIERQLTENMGLTVSYLWSRGIGLYTSRDMNVGALGPDVTYRINDSAAIRLERTQLRPIALRTVSIPVSDV